MNPCHTQKRIIQIALQLITRKGIRAFRVEEMTRILGMSKRTVYKFFPTRFDLLEACIREIDEMVRMKISFCTTSHEENPLLRLHCFIEEYVNGLYEPECVFWEDLRQLPEFRNSYLDTRNEWQTGGEKVLEYCKKKGYIRQDTNIPMFNKRLLTGLFESRLNDEPYDQQPLFCQIMLRGIATDSGRILLEKIMK